MNAINDFLLNLFTGTDDLRPALTCPNLEDGIVSATDGCVLIQIPNEHLTLTYQTNDKFPDTQGVINDMEGRSLTSIKVKVSDIAKELTRARLVIDKDSIIKCKECNGTGVVEWEYTDRHNKIHQEDKDCPICEGEGSFETDSSFARVRFDQIEYENGKCYGIYIGDLYFHPFQLYRLFMVALVKGFEEIEIQYDKEQYGKTLTYIGEIKVLIMLMRKPESEL